MSPGKKYSNLAGRQKVEADTCAAIKQWFAVWVKSANKRQMGDGAMERESWREGTKGRGKGVVERETQKNKTAF